MKPTYEELEKELAVVKEKLDEEHEWFLERDQKLKEANQELQSLKSYSTGEVDEVADSIAFVFKDGKFIMDSIDAVEVKHKIIDALSSIHQKYRGELGEIREALEKLTNYSPEIATKALTKLTKLIGEK